MSDGFFNKSPATNFQAAKEFKNTFKSIPVANRDFWFTRMDQWGEDRILGYIAEGYQVAEIAIDNGIPLLYLQEWIAATVDPKRLEIAMKSFASVSLLKAELITDYSPMGPADARAQQTQAEHYRWLAANADPAQWTPPKQKQAAAPAVSIVIDMGGDTPKLKATQGKAIADQQMAQLPKTMELDAVHMDFGSTTGES